MSSLIEFRNLTFNGDQVTFDIHVNLPPGASQWEGFALYGSFGDMDPAYFTMHTIDGQTLFNNTNSTQIEMFVEMSGSPFTTGATVATFSGPASVFSEMGGSGGFDSSAWDFGDLFNTSGVFGIGGGEIYALDSSGNYIQTDVTIENITEGTTTPSGPEYTHIGNSVGGTSGVDTTTSEYDSSTGPVEFIQGVSPEGISFLAVDNSSLYVDNGGTNDYDESTLDADGNPTLAPTPENDLTMGVYLDMGLGLASALVPSANTVTTPVAAEVYSYSGPGVSFSEAYTVDLSTLDTDQSFSSFTNAIALDMYIDMAALEAAQSSIGQINGIHLNYGFTDTELTNDMFAWSEVADSDFVNSGLWPFSMDAGVEGSTIWLHNYSSTDTLAVLQNQGTDQAQFGTLYFDAENFSTSSFDNFYIVDALAVEYDSSVMGYIDPLPDNIASITTPEMLLETLDASVNNVNELPWAIILSEQDDIFIGRDAVEVAPGTYDPGLEYVHATTGNDTIDGGGGLNAADFSLLMTDDGVDFDMSSGFVEVYTTNNFYQNWHGFQIALGTDNYDIIWGTGEEDNAVPEEFMHFHFGDTHISSLGGGANIMVSNGGDAEFYGNGGSDFLYLDGSTEDSSTAKGGSGADIIAFGLGTDDVYGDGGEHHHRDSSSSDMSSSDSSMSEVNATDDFYNDEVTFAMFDIDEHGGSGLTPPTGTITFNTGSRSFSFDLAAGATWDDFVNEANKQLNLDLGNLEVDGSGNVVVAENKTPYAYVVRETVDVYDTVANDSSTIAATSALKIYYGEGLEAPDIAGYHVPDTNESYDPTLYPAGAPSATFVDPDHGGTATYAADMFAPTMQFIEGTGDDNDVFVAYDLAFSMNTDDGVQHGIEAIHGDTISDLDIGQNSLSLAADRGESIYFETGLIDENATKVTVSLDDVTNQYSADVTLTDFNGNTASFTLDNLNGPTTALYGDQTYQLAAVWEDVGFDASVKEVGLGVDFDASNGASSLTELTFEWQGLGEKVGSNEVDMLTGSNGSNTFQAYGGDDVLNGAGGGDTYQFTGIFGNDKVLDFGNTGTDILQIGAGVEDVWLERKGRRGDELEITVNDGENVGTISVGRQFNPYTTIAAVEEIHFGFDGTKAQEVATISNGMNSGDIKVLKDGEEHFHLHGDSGSVIYMNQNEGAGTVKVTWRDSYSDTFDASNPIYLDNIGLEIEYANHEDEFFIELETDVDGNYVAGGTGALHSLLSKSGISVVHQDGNQGINVGSSVNGDGHTEFQFTDADSGALLFALETINAASYGA